MALGLRKWAKRFLMLKQIESMKRSSIWKARAPQK